MNRTTCEVIFANGVTLQEVVSEGQALKVPYMDGIFTICMSIFPRINNKVDGIKVVKGFISRSQLYNDILNPNERPTKYQLLHTRAKALELTWSNFSYEKALVIGRIIFETLEDNMHIIIKDASVGFYRDQRDKRLIRSTNGTRSVILK